MHKQAPNTAAPSTFLTFIVGLNILNFFFYLAPAGLTFTKQKAWFGGFLLVFGEYSAALTPPIPCSAPKLTVRWGLHSRRTNRLPPFHHLARSLSTPRCRKFLLLVTGRSVIPWQKMYVWLVQRARSLNLTVSLGVKGAFVSTLQRELLWSHPDMRGSRSIAFYSCGWE